jgi:glycosyltransferase involved in cell wall biosynthesis
MVGRATDPRKNVTLLLRSFSIIKRQFPELKLIIIGDKPEDSRLEKICTQLGIEDSVYLLGRLPNEDTIKYYTQAKLSVLPSLQEGLGIAVLESMACGTPVVSTKCGGPEEIIIHGENGYLVENNNVKALANGVCKLLADDALRRKMGEKAREHILKHYSLEQIMPKFLEVYKEVYPHLFGAMERLDGQYE